MLLLATFSQAGPDLSKYSIEELKAMLDQLHAETLDNGAVAHFKKNGTVDYYTLIKGEATYIFDRYGQLLGYVTVHGKYRYAFLPNGLFYKRVPVSNGNIDLPALPAPTKSRKL